jgi:hypothetical protein
VKAMATTGKWKPMFYLAGLISVVAVAVCIMEYIFLQETSQNKHHKRAHDGLDGISNINQSTQKEYWNKHDGTSLRNAPSQCLDDKSLHY